MPIPKQSAMSDYAKGAYFSDSFSTQIAYQNQTALEVYLQIASRIPSWVSFLMKSRNQIVGKLGLKNLGRLEDVDLTKASSDYQVGDRIGIFTLVSHSEQEVVLEDRDKHLDVRVSFFIEPQGEKANVHASTVVHINNWFGKVYMFFVTPFHKIIVPASLKSIRNGN